jgi:hypothetical protein
MTECFPKENQGQNLFFFLSGILHHDRNLNEWKEKSQQINTQIQGYLKLKSHKVNIEGNLRS